MLPGEIATYLAGAGLGLTLGTSLFAVPFPEAAQDRAVYVEIFGGRENDRTFGPSLQAPLGENVEFLVIVRDSKDSAQAAEQLANDIYKKLDSLGVVTLSGVIYRDVHVTQGPPRFLAFDQNNRPLYYCAYEADKDRS
jgi:hypothetical protein